MASSNSVWFDLLAITQEGAVSLGLTYQLNSATTPLAAGRIVTRKFPTSRGLDTFPALVIAQGEQEQYVAESFETTNIRYPVYVVTLFASNQDEAPNNDELQWRQSILDMAVEFETTLAHLLPAQQPAVICGLDVDFRPALDLTMFAANLDVGAMLLTYEMTRERTR